MNNNDSQGKQVANTDIVIAATRDEFAIIMAALAYYRMANFPMGKSSPGNPISHRERNIFARNGMILWNKLHDLNKEA